MNAERILEDVHEATAYLKQQFNKEKIIPAVHKRVGYEKTLEVAKATGKQNDIKALEAFLTNPSPPLQSNRFQLHSY